jgi:murein L,D-transpeptidase YcbB/YkuD
MLAFETRAGIMYSSFKQSPGLLARLLLVWASFALGMASAAAQHAPAIGDAAVGSILAKLAKPDGRIIAGNHIAGWDFLPKLYAAAGNAPLWTHAQDLAALKEAVARSWEDGLDPNDFHSKAVESAALPLSVEQDIVLSDALARLLYQLYFGKVNPQALSADWNFARPVLSADPASAISQALNGGTVSQLISRVRLAHPLYDALKATLQTYTQIDAKGGWPSVAAGPTLKFGTKDERVVSVRARLAITGEYQATPADEAVFDEPLLAAVKVFQRQHGLDEDGAVGPATLTALNVSAGARINQIRINLERARWILRDIGPEMVVVNIAGRYLHLIFDHKVAWTTRVIVGRAYTKTPIFTEAMEFVVLNPDWTVPRSIVRNEIFSKASADPGYLDAHDYYLTDGKGGRISPQSVAWGSYTGATFPYGVVQRPGPKNALGLVKFLFPNKYSVYLHDTPSRQLFEKSDRSLSHGCIRVQEPLKLAELILGNRLGWTRAKIDAALAAKKLQTVSLPKPLPVLLLYWTVDPTFDGGAHFYPDIYGRDASLLKALDADFVPAPIAAAATAAERR